MYIYYHFQDHVSLIFLTASLTPINLTIFFSSMVENIMKNYLKLRMALAFESFSD